ncbi:hypothetical protein JB92DRAFT_3130384 [Gautieria morchelliformis]|nr:hypothetical protein JB92DRAFT_3130384 [Gautieria morchelliformis]
MTAKVIVPLLSYEPVSNQDLYGKWREQRRSVAEHGKGDRNKHGGGVRNGRTGHLIIPSPSSSNDPPDPTLILPIELIPSPSSSNNPPDPTLVLPIELILSPSSLNDPPDPALVLPIEVIPSPSSFLFYFYFLYPILCLLGQGPM